MFEFIITIGVILIILILVNIDHNICEIGEKMNL